MNRKERVLFLCTGNSCRSQMAEGLLRAMAPERFDVLSAGMEPQDKVHPLAVQAMAEIGIDISGQKPKSVKAYLGLERITRLIIVCDKAKQTCPRVWPLLDENARIYWPFDDPADATGTNEEKLPVFRRVRDEIREKLQHWLTAEQR